MYPEPFFPAEAHRQAREEIRGLGFAPDAWLDRLDVPVLGLNAALHWPLPAALREAYERLYAQLLRIAPGAYVYPHAQTHVTVATLVSFKRHERPPESTRDAIHARLPRLAQLLDDAARRLSAFEIDIGPPVLVRSAAFLPILNPSGEIAAVRRHLADALAGDADLQIPQALHSTILRFREPPADVDAFLAAFDDVAREARLGRTLVDEILITTETHPYMMAGRIVHRSHLKLPGARG